MELTLIKLKTAENKLIADRFESIDDFYNYVYEVSLEILMDFTICGPSINRN